MRTPIVAGNWKMHTSLDQALELIEDMVEPLEALDGVDRYVCPPSIWIPLIYENVEGTEVRLAAQNMYWKERGAFTGELSPLQVAEFCSGVIIGHSERRQYFCEDDESVNKKVHAALEHELLPIVCVGERLDQRDAGEAIPFVTGQIRAALAGLSAEQAAGIVIAYEPIWAIGTGRAATPEDANEMIGAIRRQVGELFDARAADAVRIQYGGSVTTKNIAALMAMPEIDGALVGGASLEAEDFVYIAETAAQARQGT